MPLFMDNSSSSSASHTDETMTVDSSASPRTSLASRIQRRMRRPRFHSKFDTLAKEEQRHLADEIKTCKSYVRNLQTSYNLRSTTKENKLDIMQVLAKKHATDLSEEISLCEQEFKRMEDTSHHSSIQNMDGSAYYNHSRSKSRLFPLLHRTNSLQQQQKAPTAA